MRIACLVITLALCISCFAQDSVPAHNARYMLFAANVPTVDDGHGNLPVQQQLFLLDTATGKVWQFHPDAQIQDQNGTKKIAFSEMFSPVFVAQSDSEAAQHAIDAVKNAMPIATTK